jgi:hypothetical protein
MPDLVKVRQALELAMRVTVGEPIRREIEAAIAELEPSDAQWIVRGGAPDSLTTT